MKAIFVSILMTISSLTFSQLEIGFSLGGNMANLPGDDDVIQENAGALNIDELLDGGQAELLTVNNKSRLAPSGGIKLKYTLTENWALESGLYYSPQGDEIDGEGLVRVTVLGEERELPVDYQARSETDYITLPLLANYSFSNGFQFRFGPQVGYRLNGTAFTDGYFPDTMSDLSYEEDISDRIKEIDLGGIGGLSYQWENGFGIDAQHFLAATQLPKEDRKVHNSITSLRLFYFFDK